MVTLNSLEEYTDFVKENQGALIYFSTPQCNVCKVLKPKIKDFVEKEFEKVKMAYIDTETLPEVAAQNGIFAVPTILVFFEGKEFLRKSRNISLVEFREELQRPYSLFFED